MSTILDTDTLFIFIVLFFISVANINPYMVFAGALIGILVGIAKLIQFYLWLKDRR